MSKIKAAGKFLLKILSAAAGIGAAMMLFSSFMIVEVEGSAMMPELMPGQKILVSLYDRDSTGDRDSLAAGDIIVYEAPVYDIDGQGGYLVRRIAGIRGKWIEVTCENIISSDTADIIEKEQVLGKVIKLWERRNAS